MSFLIGLFGLEAQPAQKNQPKTNPLSEAEAKKLEAEIQQTLPGKANPEAVSTRGAATTIQHGRISFQIPGRWKTARKGSSLVAVRQDQPGQQLMIAEPSSVRTWSASAYLANGIKGLESKSGWRALKAMPTRIGEGLTRQGHGFAFQARVIRNQQNKNQFMAYYAIATGNRFQTIIAFGQNADAFRSLTRSLGQSLEKVSVNLPRASVAAARGKNFDFFNYKAIAPAGGKLIQGPYSNMIVLQLKRLAGSNYTFGNTNRFVVEYELQPSNPVSPLKALETYLLGRTTLDNRVYDSPRLRKNNPRIVAASEGQLPGGLSYTGLAMQQTPDDRYYMGAYLIQGQGSSVIVASGFKLFRYDLIKKGSTAQQEHKAWYNFYNKDLLSLAASVRFDNNRVKRDRAAENWLIRKKNFRFFRQSNITGSGISVFSSKKSNWSFRPGNKVSYEIDNFTSFNDTSFNNSTGRYDISSGYLTGDSRVKDKTFQVWTGPRRNKFIIVQHKSGLATFHITTIGNNFTIDGKRNGCCR